MIKIDQIYKSFVDKKVLNNISLNFEDHMTHIILGTSGCGKSTLLKCIMGLQNLDSGTITFNGTKVNSQTRGIVLEQIGYSVQNGGLFPHITAEENIFLKAKTLNWSSQKLKSRLEELLKIVPLEIEALRQYPDSLSGGQKQRVGLLRALFLDPPCIFFDEPLGALDPVTRSQLQHDLKKLFSNLKKTVLLVTHDIHEATFLGDRLYLLNQGEVAHTGTIEDFLKCPKNSFVYEFVTAQQSQKLAQLLAGE